MTCARPEHNSEGDASTSLCPHLPLIRERTVQTEITYATDRNGTFQRSEQGATPDAERARTGSGRKVRSAAQERRRASLRFETRAHLTAFEAQRKASTSVADSDALFHGPHNHSLWFSPLPHREPLMERGPWNCHRHEETECSGEQEKYT